MSETVDAAVKALAARLDGQGLEGSVQFVIADEGVGADRRDRRD